DEALKYNDVALACYGEDNAPRALWTQRAELFEKRDQRTEAARLLERAKGKEPQTQDRYLLAQEEIRKGTYPRAIPTQQRPGEDDPENFAAWYLLGNCCLDGLTDGKGRPAEAVAHFSACVALRPRFHGAWYNRGLANLRLKRDADAEADFTHA